MDRAQPGITAPVPRLGRYLSFDLASGPDPADAGKYDLGGLESSP